MQFQTLALIISSLSFAFIGSTVLAAPLETNALNKRNVEESRQFTVAVLATLGQRAPKDQFVAAVIAQVQTKAYEFDITPKSKSTSIFRSKPKSNTGPQIRWMVTASYDSIATMWDMFTEGKGMSSQKTFELRMGRLLRLKDSTTSPPDYTQERAGEQFFKMIPSTTGNEGRQNFFQNRVIDDIKKAAEKVKVEQSSGTVRTAPPRTAPQSGGHLGSQWTGGSTSRVVSPPMHDDRGEGPSRRPLAASAKPNDFGITEEPRTPTQPSFQLGGQALPKTSGGRRKS